jgi:DNA replicative helicase MCM subunit Mcm2 (Cdc46/Mcm family)
MADQINSTGRANNELSSDQLKFQMQEAATEFMGINENEKRIKNMMGRSNRLSVDIDEVRKFNPRLANYIKNRPIEGIKIFEDLLNTKVRNF